MPIYYFDIDDDEGLHRDEIGVELADMDAAIREARRTLTEMAGEAASDREIEIHIRDHGEGPVTVSISTSTRRPEQQDS